MTALFFDIETIPSQAPGALEQVRAVIKPPAQFKRADSIAAWHAEHGDEAAEDAYRKMALSPSEGEVCAIGYAVEDDPVSCLVRGIGETERDFLARALGAVEAGLYPWRSDTDPLLCGHNLAAFDAPFLRARLWANRLPLPRWLPGAMARHPRELIDTMIAFCGPRDRISLDRLCKALRVPSPKADGTTGADVFGLWREGRHEELGLYCMGDVQAVRSVWHVMTGAAVEAAA